MGAKRPGKKPNKRSAKAPRPRAAARKEQGQEALEEFSDGYNDFYVDEIKERREQKKEEKRQKKQEKENKPISPMRRKIRRIVSYCLIVAVILVVGVVLSLTVLFKTQNYEVVGNTHYDEAELIDTCGINKGENIFLAPKSPAERRIQKKYPYVEQVSVSFKIPDTIKIAVTEAIEGYLVKVSDAEYLVISTKGRILNKTEDNTAYDLPIFIGPTPQSGEIGEYVKYDDNTIIDIIDEITEVFADNGYSGITEIDATDPANISFTYDNRIKIKIGIPEAISYKIRTAMTIINENIDVNTAAKIEGVLDVSRCNITKKSYFSEKPLLSLDATEPATDAYGNPVEPTESGDTPSWLSDGTSDTGDSSGMGDSSNTGEGYVEPTEAPATELPVEDWYL